MRFKRVFLLCVSLCTISAPFTSNASPFPVECIRPGEVHIKPEDRAAATAAGVPIDYPCWIPGQPYVGQEAGEAKVFLDERKCSFSGVPEGMTKTGRAPACPNGIRPIRIDGLDPKFAICVAAYIKKFEAEYGKGTICVHDAYRAPGEQQCAANGGSVAAAPGTSRHERGQAVDLNPRNGATDTTMRQFADENETGIWFRYTCARDSSPANDRKQKPYDCPHMEIKHVSCSSGNFTPSSSIPYAAGGGAPSASISSAVRSWFAPPQQVNQPVVAQPAKASQPIAASQNPLGAFAEPAPLPSVSGQINVTTTNGSSSPADRLEDLAFPKRPATSTATTVPIVVTASEAAALSSTQTTAFISTTSIQGVVSLGQSTFVSPDLSWFQGNTALSQPTTGWQATIANIKAILERILVLLTPFRNGTNLSAEEAVE